MKFTQLGNSDLHDKNKWRTLESEYLFKRPWLTVRKDKVELPNGSINSEYYILEYPTWVNVIAITKDDRMLLVRQYRHGLGETRLELCAGVVEAGEAPIEGAKRELLEETGYSGGKWQEFMISTANASTMTNRTFTYLAVGVEPQAKQQLDETEDLEVILLDQDEVFELLKAGEFMQALMIAPLWKYFYERADLK